MISADQAIDRYHLTRMWAERHDESTHVFANGEVANRETRRAAIRANLRAQRSAVAYAAAHPEQARWVAVR